jgi:hypothetical protein
MNENISTSSRIYGLWFRASSNIQINQPDAHSGVKSFII